VEFLDLSAREIRSARQDIEDGLRGRRQASIDRPRALGARGELGVEAHSGAGDTRRARYGGDGVRVWTRRDGATSLVSDPPALCCRRRSERGVRRAMCSTAHARNQNGVYTAAKGSRVGVAE